MLHEVSMRLVLVVAGLYLTLVYVMSAFSLLLTHYGSSSRLQSISISFLSLSQHHHFRFNHFRIHFVYNELKKTN
jgi:hypothetical protein